MTIKTLFLIILLAITSNVCASDTQHLSVVHLPEHQSQIETFEHVVDLKNGIHPLCIYYNDTLGLEFAYIKGSNLNRFIVSTYEGDAQVSVRIDTNGFLQWNQGHIDKLKI